MANAHLFPRALVHEIRGDEPEIYIIDKRRQGFRHSQAGIWDPNILCKTHEAALGAGDDYAIRWIRSFDRRAMPIENGLGFQVPNPNPGRLRQFVYSVLWRHTVSDQTPRGDADVGPWERSLRDAIFASGPFRPPFFIARKRWLAGGEHQGDLMVVPHHCPNWGHRAFAFEVGGLLWGVKLDSREFNNDIHADRDYRANLARVMAKRALAKLSGKK